MITRTICIKEFQSKLTNNELYDKITGRTDDGIIYFYTGQTNINAYVLKMPILLLQNIDDIGFYSSSLEEWEPFTVYNIGNTLTYNNRSYKCILSHTSNIEFEYIYWEETPINNTTGYTVTITGDSHINLFRRFGKTDIDPDLYNSSENTEFNQLFIDSNGTHRKITGQRENIDSLSYQPLYDYSITGESGVIMSYSDIGNKLSQVSYKTSGLTEQNSIEIPSIKLDYLIGIIDSPKINIDVFINRGVNSSYDRHVRLNEIKSLDDLENYGNGFYKIKED